MAFTFIVVFSCRLKAFLVIGNSRVFEPISASSFFGVCNRCFDWVHSLSKFNISYFSLHSLLVVYIVYKVLVSIVIIGSVDS